MEMRLGAKIGVYVEVQAPCRAERDRDSDDGAPTKLLKVEGDWWKFDAQGRTLAGRMEAIRAAIHGRAK